MKHGMARSATYRIWNGMKQRCMNPKNPNFVNYGGRGIVVCERWLEFANFLSDMGERPPGLSIDRIDPDGHYEPGNCRWATSLQQARNKRGTSAFLRGPGAELPVLSPVDRMRLLRAKRAMEGLVRFEVWISKDADKALFLDGVRRFLAGEDIDLRALM